MAAPSSSPSLRSLALPAPLAAAWKHRIYGTLLRVVGGLVLLRVGLGIVLSPDPPLGVYLNGIVVGSLYGLMAIGLILVYRGTRVINFAQASMGASTATLAYVLTTNRKFPYLLSVAILLVTSLALGALIELIFVR